MPSSQGARKVTRTFVVDPDKSPFDSLKDDPNSKPTLILNGCTADNADDAAVFAEHLEIAQAGNVPFISINIFCDTEDHQRRFGDPTRYEELKSKLRDRQILQLLLSNHELLDPTKCSPD
ncbi:uncharacterized protein N7529_009711 [Penicillium soppii]|jgi:hypothetical protein|uniref:uncharacterized protein n=1 Tax=Penicillium soppii TaxID=69789 RepID=UPI00254909AD|nr:uncharacterized protein N7529_009711 [Penicillium soppii]KAJ5855767.1 hypothetical protein N7529_009711 [Penicillium soppii]